MEEGICLINYINVVIHKWLHSSFDIVKISPHVPCTTSPRNICIPSTQQSKCRRTGFTKNGRGIGTSIRSVWIIVQVKFFQPTMCMFQEFCPFQISIGNDCYRFGLFTLIAAEKLGFVTRKVVDIHCEEKSVTCHRICIV